MSIQIQCDKCQATYVVSDDKAGKTGKCRCGNEIPVPMPASAPLPTLPPLPPTPPQSILDELGPEGGCVGQDGTDSPFPKGVEGEAHVPGGMRCPKCQMISRPGATCEWCNATLAAPQPAATHSSAAAEPTGELRVFGALGDAWSLVWRRPGLNLGGTALAYLLAAGVYIWGAAVLPPMMASVFSGPLLGFIPPAVLGAVAAAPLMLIMIVCLSPLMVGPLYVISEVATKRRPSLGAIFRGYSSFWSIVGASVLLALVSLAVSLCRAMLARVLGAPVGVVVGIGVPAFIKIFVGVAFSLTYMEIVDRRAGAFEALGASWETTEGYRLRIFAVYLLLYLVAIAPVVLLYLAAISSSALRDALPGGSAAMVPLLALFACWVAAVAGFFNAAVVVIYRNLRGLEGGGK